uniref:Uncharacterized protein n=1 Tax=Oryza sativa subsp. japonica TaxID=39947 RepID=Q6YUX2_ORYSJ|nr:hypothetical protein [Oryza sativa Japonica Group]BAD16448.1 hypothetical protein [Oryza sativa Japonica Group]
MGAAASFACALGPRAPPTPSSPLPTLAPCSPARRRHPTPAPAPPVTAACVLASSEAKVCAGASTCLPPPPPPPTAVLPIVFVDGDQTVDLATVTVPPPPPPAFRLHSPPRGSGGPRGAGDVLSSSSPPASSSPLASSSALGSAVAPSPPPDWFQRIAERSPPLSRPADRGVGEDQPPPDPLRPSDPPPVARSSCRSAPPSTRRSDGQPAMRQRRHGRRGGKAAAGARGAKAASIKIEQTKPRRISQELAQASAMEEVVVGKERKRPRCALVGVGGHDSDVADEPGGVRARRTSTARW